jgi:hypothetical protein
MGAIAAELFLLDHVGSFPSFALRQPSQSCAIVNNKKITMDTASQVRFPSEVGRRPTD